MAPPPGTYERVTRQARRRKVSRAILSAAGAVVIVAGLAASPNVASLLRQHPASRGRSGLAAGRRPARLPPPVTTRPSHGSPTRQARRRKVSRAILSAAGAERIA